MVDCCLVSVFHFILFLFFYFYFQLFNHLYTGNPRNTHKKKSKQTKNQTIEHITYVWWIEWIVSDSIQKVYYSDFDDCTANDISNAGATNPSCWVSRPNLGALKSTLSFFLFFCLGFILFHCCILVFMWACVCVCVCL